MTPPRLHSDYVRDILDAIAKATSFVSGMSVETFAEDARTSFAVIRALEIVGEAARQIPADVRAAYPGVPWKAMTGIRDKLIHQYFGVDLEVIWRTVQDDLPPLLAPLASLLTDLERSESE
jgi:uncharacterized protein with HEPN domain